MGRQIYTGSTTSTLTYPAPASQRLSYRKWITNNTSVTLTITTGTGTTITVGAGATSYVNFSSTGCATLK